MPYIELSYDKIINDIAEYINHNKKNLKKRTLKKKNNKSKKINKKI
jgi:hypothetical protein